MLAQQAYLNTEYITQGHLIIYTNCSFETSLSAVLTCIIERAIPLKYWPQAIFSLKTQCLNPLDRNFYPFFDMVIYIDE